MILPQFIKVLGNKIENASKEQAGWGVHSLKLVVAYLLIALHTMHIHAM